MSNKVNITLSADAETIQSARQYASAHGTTLNQLVRDFMGRLTGASTSTDAAREFASVAQSHPGCSSDGYRFDRDEVHVRRDED